LYRQHKKALLARLRVLCTKDENTDQLKLIRQSAQTIELCGRFTYGTGS